MWPLGGLGVVQNHHRQRTGSRMYQKPRTGPSQDVEKSVFDIFPLMFLLYTIIEACEQYRLLATMSYYLYFVSTFISDLQEHIYKQELSSTRRSAWPAKVVVLGT